MLSGTYNATASGIPNQSAVVSGRYLYFTTSTGFHKFDLLTLGYTYNILPAAAYQAVKFDGGNSLYVTNGSTTIYKINLSDDSYTTYLPGVAISAIAIDDDYLYAVSNASSTTATVKKVTLSSFTEASSWTITIGSVANTVTHVSTADYSGYLYVAAYTATTRTDQRLVRILTSTGTNSSVIPTSPGSVSAVQGAQPIFYDGEYLWFAGGNNTYAVNGFIADKINLSTFTITNIQASAANPVVPTIFSPGLQAYGCIEPPAYAGMLLYFNNNNSNSTPYKIIYSDPRFPLGLTSLQVDQANTVIDSTNPLNFGQYATDQTALYVLNTNQVIVYNGSFRNYNFNGVQTANLLIPQ